MLLVLILITLVMIYDYTFPYPVNTSYSTQIKDRNGVLLHAFLTSDDKWRMYAELDEITPLLRKTILFKEDKYFYYHPGINPVAIARALLLNTTRGKKVSGASTITMQVVRMLEPRPRTYKNKLIEIWNALRLERQFSKNEILQLYYNLIPLGGNVEGIKSGSILYFGKPPQLLSLAEITTLTVIPNNPRFLNPRTGGDRLLAERNRWLIYFKEKGLFTPQVIDDALNEPLTAIRREAPKAAPHLSVRLKRQTPDKAIVKTTLSQTIQQQTETLVSNYMNRIRTFNIQNAAVLIVNNETMEVEGYVGSANFNNPVDGGQVDGVRAIRSPGSTLKPFLYALAFDKGIVIPQTVINDVPSNFDGYEPENFDRKFNGPVTVAFALSHSLNIPAVKLLQKVEMKGMVEGLKKAGFRTIEKQEQDLGLSLILGGCGTTLEELTRLYATFARGGNFASLNYLTDRSSSAAESELISEEAAFLTTRILAEANRPDLPNHFDHTFRLPKIAWKTGTSYGKRDAWSIGYNKKYTVGVWVGNFSGTGVPELSGANIATPLLFDIFNTIDYNASSSWFTPPSGLELRKVCAHTGDVPGEGCEEIINGEVIPGVSIFKRCEHSKPVFVNEELTVSYCGYCLPPSGTVRKHFPNFEPELIAFYNYSKIPFPKIPPHNPNCSRIFENRPPQIVNPREGAEIFIQKEHASEIQLLCHASPDVHHVTWLVNDRILQKAPPSQPVFFKPPIGVVKISCADDKGRNTDIVIFTKQF